MVMHTYCPSYLGGWGRRIVWIQEAGVTVSWDGSRHCTPAWATETPSQKKKKIYIESFGQVLPNYFEVSMVNCFSFVLATPCPKSHIGCSSPCFQSLGTENSLCFGRWKLSIHLFFTVTCSGSHFTKCLVSFIVSGKESSINIVLLWI